MDTEDEFVITDDTPKFNLISWGVASVDLDSALVFLALRPLQSSQGDHRSHALGVRFESISFAEEELGQILEAVRRLRS